MDWMPFFVATGLTVLIAFVLNYGFGNLAYRNLVKGLHNASFLILIVLGVILFSPFVLMYLQAGSTP